MSEAVRRELTVPCETSCLGLVRRTVLEVAAHAQFPAGEAQLIALAVDEAVANIIEHSYVNVGEAAGAAIGIALEGEPGRFRVWIRDHGRRFDPTAVPKVDIRQHVRQGRRGGLGIFLIRRIMDEVRYDFLPPERINELQLVKYRPGARPAAAGSLSREEGASGSCR